MENSENKNHEKKVKILVFSASMRTDSYNTCLAKLAAKVIGDHDGIVDLAEMKEFDCPSYNQDIESKGIFPDGAQKFRDCLLTNDAFVIASPEYNASMPGNLKNIIDWVSRYRPQPFNEKHALLMSASPSMVGGNRGLWALRVPLEHLGARVFPNMFSLAMAHQAFDDNQCISNPTLEKRFDDNVVAFMELVEAAKNYPCIKKAWVEFLGEKPDPVTERVE